MCKPAVIQISGLVCGDWVAAMGGDPPRGAKVGFYKNY